jgi:DNA repair exonuclease SbcCD ATPase subunit
MEKENKSESSKDIQSRIKDRESWFKIIIVIMLTGLIFYKLAVSDLNFDFSAFDFSQLLSLIMALFSIGLSVAFYFKATDTSNKFYDNTYKFTKEISEILGRIEAGFGERLRHLDEGYTGLIDKFDGNSFNNKTDDIEEAKKEFEEERQKIEKEVEEKNQILSSLMQRAKLNDKEKQEFINSLKQKEEEISSLNSELRYLKRNINRAERTLSNEIIHSVPASIREMLIDYIKLSRIDINLILEAPTGYLKRKLRYERENLPSIFRERFLKYGIINDDNDFTENGIELLKNIAQKI